MNDLFIYSGQTITDDVTLGIGSHGSKRTVTLSGDDALKLAYRLMSLARGGQTQGFERFERGR